MLLFYITIFEIPLQSGNLGLFNTSQCPSLLIISVSCAHAQLSLMIFLPFCSFEMFNWFLRFQGFHLCIIMNYYFNYSFSSTTCNLRVLSVGVWHEIGWCFFIFILILRHFYSSKLFVHRCCDNSQYFLAIW